MDDVVVNETTMELRRKSVRKSWAAIEHQTHMASFISSQGFAVKENSQRPSHRITVRMQHELDYSATAWVYEEFLKSPPRWYKVLGFVDEENFVMLECHLVERNEDARPVDEGALAPAPQNVEL
jgi:hypothetical protein